MTGNFHENITGICRFVNSSTSNLGCYLTEKFCDTLRIENDMESSDIAIWIQQALLC